MFPRRAGGGKVAAPSPTLISHVTCPRTSPPAPRIGRCGPLTARQPSAARFFRLQVGDLPILPPGLVVVSAHAKFIGRVRRAVVVELDVPPPGPRRGHPGRPANSLAAPLRLEGGRLRLQLLSLLFRAEAGLGEAARAASAAASAATISTPATAETTDFMTVSPRRSNGGVVEKGVPCRSQPLLQEKVSRAPTSDMFSNFFPGLRKPPELKRRPDTSTTAGGNLSEDGPGRSAS